ncbi:MAG: very short patch repair endonuclease [Bacteroides faecis]
MDIFSKEKRKKIMSKIRAKNTKPELMVRKYLYNKGYRYRINVKTLPGSPDIVLKKLHTVIFINGCFWHGHENCKLYKPPKTNTEWWLAKVKRNKDRDTRNNKKLKEMGWKVITIWECQLKSRNREKTLLALDLTLGVILLSLYSISGSTKTLPQE